MFNPQRFNVQDESVYLMIKSHFQFSNEGFSLMFLVYMDSLIFWFWLGNSQSFLLLFGLERQKGNHRYGAIKYNSEAKIQQNSSSQVTADSSPQISRNLNQVLGI